MNNEELYDDVIVNYPLPLNTKWTFWLDKCVTGMTAGDYENNLRKIYTVETVQDFWCVYNNIPLVNELKLQHSYHFMRHELRPIWEDSETRNGGVFRMKVQKSHSEEIWKNLLTMAIGEQNVGYFHQDDNLCGISLSVRSTFDFVKIWNSDVTKASVSNMKRFLRENLDIASYDILYQAHMRHLYFNGQ